MTTEARPNSGHVVLVNDRDAELGTMDKLDAHRPPGALHRAISVFVIDDAGRHLIQRRASTKYHFGGLWANACCSHPMPGESVTDAGSRRLREEIGIEATTERIGSFVYEAGCDASGLIERELDHVLLARWTGEPVLNPEEADAARWIGEDDLIGALRDDARSYAPWLPLALDVLLAGEASWRG